MALAEITLGDKIMSEVTQNEMRERLGNLEQIRELLFGQKIRDYDLFTEECHHRLNRLESDLSVFQNEVRNQLVEIQNTLTEEIHTATDSLEKKLQYLNLSSQENLSTLQTQLDYDSGEAIKKINALQQLLAERSDGLEGKITEDRQKLGEELQELRVLVFDTIDREFSQIKDNKLSRSDLAEVLFELCLKIKGSESSQELKEAPGEFLLPEHASQNNS